MLMHGWLKKKGRVRWNRRYVHLLPNRIQYFETETRKEYRDNARADPAIRCKGEIKFDRDSYVWDSKKKEGDCFKVNGERNKQGKTLHFIVDSTADSTANKRTRGMWVDAMKEACILSNLEAKKHFKQIRESHDEGKDITFDIFVRYWKVKLAPDDFRRASFNYSHTTATGRIDIATSRRETMASLEDANPVAAAAAARIDIATSRRETMASLEDANPVAAAAAARIDIATSRRETMASLEDANPVAAAAAAAKNSSVV